MLFADKRALERQLEVDLIAIRQKELDHYTHCCLTLSAPAALLAGFAYTALVQVRAARAHRRERARAAASARGAPAAARPTLQHVRAATRR